ncbi:uncharacterized protein NPIL_649921 [Nephila pilipes]|uniref:HTH OST-type domain-containing protein n=1 Tax=Nephila pilipes TaxID=299642 RepID=A0A8X6JI15_NEPPI|nr:uncharacterized protein NPIL_649921 [Nephila pilipes]
MSSGSTKPAILSQKKKKIIKIASENQKSSHADFKNLLANSSEKTHEQCSESVQLNPEKQKLKKTVLIHLRSVVQSCKGGVPLNRLDKDYRDFIGMNIPFKEFGYDSLEDFIRSIPDVINLKKNANGQIVALGVTDTSTAHLFGQMSKRKSSKESQALVSTKSPPADPAVIRISKQKNTKLPSFFKLPQSTSETDLKNVLKVPSNGVFHNSNQDTCESVDNNTQPTVSKTLQKKSNKNYSEFSAAVHSETILPSAQSKIINSDTGASIMINNTHPLYLSLQQNKSVNLPVQNLHSASVFQNGGSICDIKHQLKKDGNVPESEVVTEKQVNVKIEICSSSSNRSFDELNTQRLNNVHISSLNQISSEIPEKLDIASKSSFRSTSADLDIVEPPVMDTSVVCKRASRRRAKKQKKDILNTLKIGDNASENTDSQVLLHESGDGIHSLASNGNALKAVCLKPFTISNELNGIKASDNSCNSSESISSKISSDITDAGLNVILHLHFILSGTSNLEIFKKDILSFTGFPFSEDSEEWKEKINFVSKLPKKMLKKCLKCLCIPHSNEDGKEVLLNKLLMGLKISTKVSEEISQ